MFSRTIVARCFAKKDGGVWVAFCLDFDLATQGETFEEAKKKLEEQLYFYVKEAMADEEFGDDLLSRRAPWHKWLEYAFIKLRLAFHDNYDNLTRIFDETMPLRIA